MSMISHMYINEQTQHPLSCQMAQLERLFTFKRGHDIAEKFANWDVKHQHKMQTNKHLNIQTIFFKKQRRPPSVL